MRVEVLEDIGARIEGLRFLETRAIRPRRTVVDLRGCRLREGVWALPSIEAILARDRRIATFVVANEPLLTLLAESLSSAHANAHFVAETPLRANGGTMVEEDQTLTVVFAPNAGRRSRARPRAPRRATSLVVPSRPFSHRRQHRWAHWMDGARLIGFDARAARPRLKLPRASMSEAREWARSMLGISGGPIVALCPSSRGWRGTSFGDLADLFRRRIGALVVGMGHEREAASIPGLSALPSNEPLLMAGVLALCAVCVGDSTADWLHVAAAVGSPAVSLHGSEDPVEYGAASAAGAALWAEECRCSGRVARPAACLSCLPVNRVAKIADRLAGDRWPSDRLAQWFGFIR